MTGRNSFILGCLCTSHSAPRDTWPCAYRGAGRHRRSDTLETEKTRRSVSGISTASLSPSVFISLSRSLAVSFRVGRRLLSSPSPRPSQAQMPLLRQMSSVSVFFFAPIAVKMQPTGHAGLVTIHVFFFLTAGAKRCHGWRSV